MNQIPVDTEIYRCGNAMLQSFLAVNGYKMVPIENPFGKPFPCWAVPLNQEGAAQCILNWLRAHDKLRDGTETFLARVIEEQAAHEEIQ